MAHQARVDFLILGPLEVRADGEPLALGGPKQRALLALLLLSANRVVSRARLTDELWSDEGGADATHALDVQISRLRKSLAAATNGTALLQTRPPGYVLNLEPGQLDLECFELLRDRARTAREAGDLQLASACLRDADALWRGRPLADLELESVARADVERLQELRLVAIEERIDVDLDLGRHGELVAELQALVEENSLREGLRAQLMLALYRCGRQAEALDVYRELRALLVGELGIEPSARVRELERAILAQDNRLQPLATDSTATAAPEPRPDDASLAPRLPSAQVAGRARRRRRAVSALVLAAGGALVLVALLSRDATRQPPVGGDGLALVSADGSRLTATIALASSPTAVIAGLGSVWVSHAEDGTVTRVDPGQRSVRDRLRVGSGPSALAVAGGALWVANTLDGTVSRVDPATDDVTETVAVGRFPAALTTTAGAVWVANRGDGTVSRIDPDSGRVVATLRTGRAPSGITAARRTVWVANEESGTVSRIDPATNAVTQTIAVGDAPSAIAATARSVWVLDGLDSTVSRLDPGSEAVTATIALRGAPSNIVAGHDAAWVTGERTGTVVRIDDRTMAIDRTIRVGDRAEGLTVTPAGVWAAAVAGGASHRGGVLTVVAASELDSLDPAFAYSSPALVGMTNDGLVALNHRSGARGTQLVADLALSLPTASHDGLTYTFRIRPAIRYSTSGVVRARDVRRSLERLYELRSAGRSFYDAIVGTPTCRTHRGRCDLARGIQTNDRAGTVTFHLRAPDADFLYKLALPYAAVLPASTPSVQAAGVLAPRNRKPIRLPATGPYMFDRYAPGRQLRLVRNPRFREWSRAAQPDGYPDRIVVRLGLTPARGVELMRRGDGDFMSNVGPIPAVQRQTLLRRNASQLRVNRLLATDFFFLNTRVAPLNDARVRQALNLALDRGQIVRIYGGPRTATTTCQILPPQVPGYRRRCPYTRDPRQDGRWRGPDLATAKRLVAQSGTKGMRVLVWSSRTPQVLHDESRYVVTTLRRLGYAAELRVLADSQFFDYTNDSRHRAQVVSGGWNLDYPAASSMLVRLTCPYFVPASTASSNPSEFCDPAVDRQIKQATALQATRPDDASRLWQRVDRAITDRAIWLPTVTPKTTDILSRRAGNYEYHVMLGALIDQLWVR